MFDSLPASYFQEQEYLRGEREDLRRRELEEARTDASVDEESEAA